MAPSSKLGSGERRGKENRLGALFCQDEHPATSGLLGQPTGSCKDERRSSCPGIGQLFVVPLSLSLAKTKFLVGRIDRGGICCGGCGEESQLWWDRGAQPDIKPGRQCGSKPQSKALADRRFLPFATIHSFFRRGISSPVSQLDVSE